MRTVARVSVADSVHDQLRVAILGGVQPVGSLLPGEVELAAQAGVNRQAVREALQRLRQVGLIDIVQGGGARVLDWRVSGTLSLLTEAMFRTDGQLDPPVVASMFRLRMVTLIDASRLAAERRTDALAQELDGLITRMQSEDAADNPAFARGDFWEAVAVASGNVAYRLVYNTQVAIAWRLPAVALAAMLQGPEIVETYRLLAESISAGDVVAAAAHAETILAPSVQRFVEMS